MSRSPHRDAAYWVHSDPSPAERVANVPGNMPATADADPCPGSCNRAWRNAAHIDVDGRHLDQNAEPINPVLGQPVWCRPCQDHILKNLGRIPELAAAAGSRTDGRLNTGNGDTDTTRRANRTGSPSGSPALDALDEAAAWAGDWVDELAEHLAHTHRGGVGTRMRTIHLTSNITYLVNHGTALLCAPFAIEVGRGALAMVTRLEREAGQDRLKHRLPAPCPSCDRRALVRDDGAVQVDCAACGRSWPESDYRRLTLILASDYAEGGRAG